MENSHKRRFRSLFGNELFMSEKHRNVSILFLGLLVLLINSIVTILSYINLSQVSYLYLVALVAVLVSASIFCRRKYPEWSIFFLALAVFVPISFYIFNASFNRLILFGFFPLIGVCSYFILGRPAAILFSLYLIGLAYYASFIQVNLPEVNFYIEMSLYYSLFILSFGVVFFVNLQISAYENTYYRKQESMKLENLSKEHKEQVDRIIAEIRSDLSLSYQDEFARRSPKAHEAFMRAFGRIENALAEIHNLSEKEEPVVDQKIYQLWSGDRD